MSLSSIFCTKDNFIDIAIRIDTLQVMHSTASNTFIEEEDFDNLENGENTVLSSNKEPIVSKPKSAHLKKADVITGISKFNFEHPESSKYQNKFTSQEILYSEFSVRFLKFFFFNFRSRLSYF